MEENTSIFSNKIVGILVAVVVLATVLVPICNAFANSDDSSDGLNSVENIVGNRVSLFDTSDITNTGTTSYDSSFNEVQPYTMVITPSQTYQYYMRGSINSIIPFEQYEISYYGDYGDGSDMWSIGDMFLPGIKADSSTYVFDINGVHIAQQITKDYDEDEDMYIQLNESELNQLEYANYYQDIWFDDSDFGVSVYYSYNIEGNGWATHWSFDSLVGSATHIPNVVIDETGKISFDSKLVVTKNGFSYEYDLSELPEEYWNMIVFNALYEYSSDNPESNNSDSGIASTLISFIPALVAIALLGAIASLIFNRKETL